jgi:hypothetical protein
LKLNGTYELLVYADDVNILGGSIHTIRKNTDGLVIASKEIGLEVVYGHVSRSEHRTKREHTDRQ